MTFKELLDSVSYDEVERQIRKMYNYPETGNLGWYRMHFDMLRLLTPKHDDDANDDVCHITMKDWDERFRCCDIDIDFMDRWDDDVYFEKCANKNFAIIRENGGEIPTVKDLSPKRKKQLINKLKESRWYRGYRSGEVKLRCAFKKRLAARYFKRMSDISDFIVKAIPAINDNPQKALFFRFYANKASFSGVFGNLGQGLGYNIIGAV